jgi:4-hydroxy-tetrahydrodipicolinate reductase
MVAVMPAPAVSGKLAAMTPTKLLIYGASGRMGRALLRLATGDPRFQVVAAVIGRTLPPLDGLSIPVFGPQQLAETPVFDVAVDFSQPEGFDAVLDHCLARGAALVSGTTGLSDMQRQRLGAAAGKIPVLWAANFSIGVVVLEDLLSRASAALRSWDVDIVETHHTGKKDAPSGTALALGQAVQQGGGKTPNYASLRAGDVIGEHTVQFTGAGERLEFTHRAGNRDIFARGALEAATRLAGMSAGNYRLADLVFR